MTDREVLQQIFQTISQQLGSPPVVPVVPPVVPNPAPAPTVPSQISGILAYSGGYVRHNTGHAIYSMPNVAPGEECEVSVAAGWEMVKLTIRDPAGGVVINKWTNAPVDQYEFPTGYGQVVWKANLGGDYTVEVNGGGTLTTVNNWRR